MEKQTKGGLGLLLVFIGLAFNTIGGLWDLLTIPVMGMGAFMILNNVYLMYKKTRGMKNG